MKRILFTLCTIVFLLSNTSYSTSFKIMSGHVLHENFYKKKFRYSNIHGYQNERLSLQDRLTLFKNTIIAEHPDIVCLQDIDYNSKIDPFCACLENLTPYPSMSYTVLGDTYSLGLGIAFDKNRFELIDTHESKYNEKLKNGPGFFVAYLYDNEHQKVIALINTHLRGAYNAWNIKKQQLLNIKNYINNNKNAAQAWIVCGNFNIHFSTRETYEEFRKETFSRDTGWVDIDPVMQCNKKEKTPWLMTANTIDMGRKTVRRATKKERLDYLFFTGPLIKKEYRISSNNFLECDIRDKETNHYSHHGALLATFSWPEKEYLQWEEIMDKVPSKYQELVDGLPIN